MTTKPSHEELERRVHALETKNTQLEKNLHEARSLSEEVMTYMSEGFVLTDTCASIIFINKSLSEMLGYLPEEIIGKCWLDIVPIEQQGIAKDEEVRRSQGHTDRYEIVLHRKNGEKFPVLIGAGPRFDEQSGQYIGSLGVVTDVTDRKEIEAGLEKTRKELVIIKKAADEAHEFADSVINTVREPLISLDQDLRVLTVSRSFYNFFKVKPEETVGQHIYDIGNKQWDIPKLRELLETILPKKTSFDNYEIEHNFVPIGRRVMLLNARQIERKVGEKPTILLAIEDITERKRAEEERNQLVIDLQRALANVKQLTGLLPICSHCKKIRDDKGYWNQIEVYINQHSEATFSHGICQDCIKKYYPDFVIYDDCLEL